MAAQKWHSKGTGKNWKCVHEHGRGSGAAPASVCAALRVLTDAQNATKTDIKKSAALSLPASGSGCRGDLARRPANKAKNSTKKAAKLPQNATRKKAETAEKVGQKRLRKFRKVYTKKMHPGRPHKTPRNGCMERKTGRKVRKSAHKKRPRRGAGVVVTWWRVAGHAGG